MGVRLLPSLAVPRIRSVEALIIGRAAESGNHMGAVQRSAVFCQSWSATASRKWGNRARKSTDDHD